MSLIAKRRKHNLRRLIDSEFDGVVSKLADHVEIKHSMLFRVLAKDPKRNLGEKLARRIETSCGIAEGWLDADRDAPQVECLLTHKLMKLCGEDRRKIMWVVQLLEESA